MEKILIIICAFLLSTILFQKAAGTLNPGKVNIISCIYYIFMLQTFCGVTLINLGFDEHYTLGYLINREDSIRTTTYVVCLTAVLLPLLIILIQKLMKIDMKAYYGFFLNNRMIVENKKDNCFFVLFAIGVLLCLVIMVGYFNKVGYIPFMKLIFASEGFDFATERIRISSLYFINSYVTNIALFTIIPLFSYISFSYSLVERGWKWKILFLVTFFMSVFCKTYKFEKTPLVFHFMIFVLIVMYFKGGIRFVHLCGIVAVLSGIILISYIATGFQGTFLDIYNGPLGRTLFTEVGTLTYCFDLFPFVFNFLGGRSFSPTILKLMGMDPSLHLRSAKLVMAFYGSEKVYDGTAGVMNTLFVGEAYANWGYVGIVFSIVWIALLVSCLMLVVLKMKKTPGSVALLAILTVRIGSMLEGGFCDFVYSFDLIFIIGVFLGIYFCFEKENCLQKQLFDYFKKGLKNNVTSDEK